MSLYDGFAVVTLILCVRKTELGINIVNINYIIACNLGGLCNYMTAATVKVCV